MNNFERGLDPKESMEIGVDARLKELGCRFTHTRLGEPIFVKGEDPDTTISVRPLNWNSKQLRAMADYLDAHPESTKILDIIDDRYPSPAVISVAAQGTPVVKNWAAQGLSDPDIDLDDLTDALMPISLPPSKFGN
jgi:hypothetical protein